MKVKAVPSRWIRGERRRLDVGPYLYGAVEARERIRRLDAPKEPLKSLTAGPGGGIFKGPMLSRRWVTDPAHGVPFVGSSSMLLADLSHLPLLSGKYARSPRIRHMEIVPGTTLISRSGTIGRMVYARPDMTGMWSSQHIMKVCPDPARIPPGYLYAFLSSRFGVPLVTAGTYGAIIQHIEPEHIADVPVPRKGSDLERHVHRAMNVAARLRFVAMRLATAAESELLEALGLAPLARPTGPTPFSISQASAASLIARLDAFFHGRFHAEAVQGLRASGERIAPLGEIVEAVIEPGRFKRTTISDPENGVAFFGTKSIHWSNPVSGFLRDPKANRLVSVETAAEHHSHAAIGAAIRHYRFSGRSLRRSGESGRVRGRDPHRMQEPRADRNSPGFP